MLQARVVCTNLVTAASRQVDFAIVSSALPQEAVKFSLNRAVPSTPPHAAIRVSIARNVPFVHWVPRIPRKLPLVSEELRHSSETQFLWDDLFDPSIVKSMHTEVVLVLEGVVQVPAFH